jgi:hypothetical protein
LVGTAATSCRASPAMMVLPAALRVSAASATSPRASSTAASKSSVS